MRELPDPESYPVQHLGPTLEKAALAIHEKTQAPIAICAQSVLGAATLAVQGHADIELPTGQIKPLSNFLVTVAGSGERKSACDSEALRAIIQHEADLREEYWVEILDHKNRFDAWDKQRQQILSDKQKYPGTDEKNIALAALGPKPEPPLGPMLFAPEPTIEGLAKHFLHGQPSVGVFSAEGGQFIGGHGMREEKKLLSVAGYSSLWDGEPIRRIRAGDGSVIISGRRLAIHLMAQPDVAAIMLSDRVLADQGFLSRLLVVAPKSAAGTRLWKEADARADIALTQYSARLLSILKTPFPLVENTRNELSPHVIKLSAEARSKWVQFADHIEGGLGSGGAFDPIRGLAGKLPEHAARLGAVIALVDNLNTRLLSPDHMGAGIVLAQFYAEEAMRLFSIGMVSENLRTAQFVLDWLLSRYSGSTVPLSYIYQFGPSQIRTASAARKVMKILEEHNWVASADGGAVIDGHKYRDAWKVWEE
nr:YfjI family protein [Sneathiella litorea]